MLMTWLSCLKSGLSVFKGHEGLGSNVWKAMFHCPFEDLKGWSQETLLSGRMLSSKHG
jgi:hypothetical protein